ncbi:MAG: hypothetical protein D3923_12315 [Candidatus Electrothrix sp. AR3]|nr:hypothetical protein [Candidatus Electrothrix sp. AR3]
MIELGASNKWGWQIDVPPFASIITKDIYAGAGQNDLDKGTKVGTLLIDYIYPMINVSFMMSDDYTMNETHLYVGLGNTTTGAPGQFGHLHTGLAGASSDSYNINLLTDPTIPPFVPLKVVAHAVVCGDFSEE